MVSYSHGHEAAQTSERSSRNGDETGVSGHLVTRAAEATARVIATPSYRASILAVVAVAAVAVGDLDRAEALAQEVTVVLSDQAAVRVAIAEAAAKAGDLDRAEALAQEVTVPSDQAAVRVAIAEAAAKAGDLDRAEALAQEVTVPSDQAAVRVAIAEAAAKAGDLDRAEALAQEVVLATPNGATALAVLAQAAAGAGDRDRAQALTAKADAAAQASIVQSQPVGALAALATRTARAGDPNRAETLARSITNLFQRERALAALAEVAAAAGDLDNDIIGFHTPSYRHNFLQCCEDLTRSGRHHRSAESSMSTTVTSGYGLSVPDRRQRRPTVAERGPACASSRASCSRRRHVHLILRVDRADLLQERAATVYRLRRLPRAGPPEFRERVTFIAQLMPSRTDVPEYAEYLERIEAVVAVVNHRHGSPTGCRSSSSSATTSRRRSPPTSTTTC